MYCSKHNRGIQNFHKNYYPALFSKKILSGGQHDKIFSIKHFEKDYPLLAKNSIAMIFSKKGKLSIRMFDELKAAPRQEGSLGRGSGRKIYKNVS